MTIYRTVTAAALTLVGVACSRHEETSRELSDAGFLRCKEIGEEASAALGKTLSAQLQAALSGGGVTSAVKVCQSVALPITESTGKQFSAVRVRRTSLAWRNPANAPDETDERVLGKWADAAGSAEPEVVPTGGGTARYYQPVLVQAVCLKCHGEPGGFGSELRSLLAELYPDDRAVGYAEGDLRGAIRVDINLAELQRE